MKTYLGDGCYVEWDGYALELTTEDGINITNRIVLEPAVYSALVRYVKALGPDTVGPQEQELAWLVDRHFFRHYSRTLTPIETSLTCSAVAHRARPTSAATMTLRVVAKQLRARIELEQSNDETIDPLTRDEWVSLLSLMAEAAVALERSEAALRAIKQDPHGCPFCDSGVFRPGKTEHWSTDCGYAQLDAVLAKVLTLAEPGETP